MKKEKPLTLVPAAIAVLCAGLFVFWVFGTKAPDFQERLPGADKQPTETAAEQQSGPRCGTLTQSDGKPSQLPGLWPRFRGPHSDGISRVPITVATLWPSSGPPRLWSIELGEGYAGAAVRNGCVYILDYDHEKHMDALRCLSLADGKEIWRYAYPVRIKRNHGMSRTIPAVTDRYVVSLGPKCHVLCVDAKDGRYRWGMDLVKEFGTVVPPWYAGQCPIIDDGKAIIAPGGDSVLMMAVDCETGKIVWKTPNPHGWKMTHSSIMPMTFDGVKMYVYCASGGVVGVSAKDGTVLWETDQWKIRIANVPSPVILPGGKIFLSGGYNAGSMMIQLKRKGEGFSVHVLYRLKPDVFGSDQQTPIFFGGKIYGVIPGGELACLDPSGKLLWRSGTAQRFGLGPYVVVDGKMFVMNDTGVLTLVDLSANEYRQLCQAKVLDGHDTWAPIAVAGGRLLVRDMTRMVCLDIRAASSKTAQADGGQ